MKKTFTLCLFLFSIFSLPVLAQKRFTPTEAADSMQTLRGQARELLNKKDAGNKKLSKPSKF